MNNSRIYVIDFFRRKLPKRYVDDCLVCARKEQQEAIFNSFNEVHQRMQFTIEQERMGEIKFLDTILRRESKIITTEWFPRDIQGRYLDFHSISPFSHKKNTIIALVDRALKLTHTDYRERTLNSVKYILKINNYPQQLVH